MANPILSKAPDKAITKALREALKAPKEQGRLSYESMVKIAQAAYDGETVDDVEFRDIKRILRTQSFWGPSVRQLEAFLELYYPLTGPFLYPGDVEELEGRKPVGTHQCAALVQVTIPIGKVATWREGIRVRGHDWQIQKGTAVATFEDGFYPNREHDNHVAYYISQDNTGIRVMDQWKGKGSISSRVLPFRGRLANGMFIDPSNNGDALSVVMKKA
jgi:hypothetical protein